MHSWLARFMHGGILSKLAKPACVNAWVDVKDIDIEMWPLLASRLSKTLTIEPRRCTGIEL